MIKKPTKWWLHEVGPSDVFASDRVALVGDSVGHIIYCEAYADLASCQVHAMLPHEGAGAGQAIEDAYILAHVLTHPLSRKETLGASLKAYERVRIPMANHVLRASKENGAMYEFDAQGLEDDYVSLGSAIEGQFAWITSTNPSDNANLALRYLSDSLLQ